MACEIKPFAGGGFAVLCGRGRKPRALCQEPGCKNVHTKLCDFTLRRGLHIGTCDKRLCDDHATTVGDDKDYCPAHAKQRPLALIASVRESALGARRAVPVQGRVLYVGEKAVKIRTPIKDEWIPLSQISESNPEIDELEEGDEATLEIPRWLAREKGLIE